MISKFLIGEVAKKFNVSRPSLIYYDQIDLLKPSIIENNGYRYYTYEDIERLELILTLKESGLKLDDIKDFLSSPSHLCAIELLENQKEKVDQKIEQLEKTKKIIEKRIENITEYNGFEWYQDIKIEKKEKVKICKYRVNYNDRDPFTSSLRNLKTVLDNYPETYGAIASKFGVCISKENILNGEFYIFKYVFEYLKSDVPSPHVDELEASYYVCCLHYGPYHFTHNTLKKLLDFIEENNYKVNGNALVIPIHDIWAVHSEEDYITEIQIPVNI